MTDITEDDRRRAQDAALSVRPRLTSEFVGMDCPLVEALALALAETRERAEARINASWKDYGIVTGNRIAKLEDENARLRGALKAPGLYQPTETPEAVAARHIKGVDQDPPLQPAEEPGP